MARLLCFKCITVLLLFFSVTVRSAPGGGQYPTVDDYDYQQQQQQQQWQMTGSTAGSAGAVPRYSTQRYDSYGRPPMVGLQGPFGDPYMGTTGTASYGGQKPTEPVNPFTKPKRPSAVAMFAKPQSPNYSATEHYTQQSPHSGNFGNFNPIRQQYAMPPIGYQHQQQLRAQPYDRNSVPAPYAQQQNMPSSSYYGAAPYRLPSQQNVPRIRDSNYGPSSSVLSPGSRMHSEAEYEHHSPKNDSDTTIHALPAPPSPPDLLSFSEPVPDLLTDSVPTHQQQQQVPNESNPNSLAIDQLSIYSSDQQQQHPKEGTVELFYTEQKMKDSKGKDRVWEIYRQRDNSGKFVKFRHVDSASGRTVFTCVAPMPDKKIKLYFNNNPNLAFMFDASGYMYTKEEEFDLDPISDWPTEEAQRKRKYNPKAFKGWIASELQHLMTDSSHPTPVQAHANTPTAYPADPALVLQWVRLPLPVHPLFAKPEQKGPGFMKLDVKEMPVTIATDGLDSVTEQMDDGGNWVKIEVKQGNSGAKFVRDPNGQPPKISEPMVLFFNGVRQYFDKTGMAISRFAVKMLKRDEEKKRKREEPDPAMEAFFRHNIEELKKEQLAEQKAEMAKQQRSNYPAPPGKAPMQQQMQRYHGQQQAQQQHSPQPQQMSHQQANYQQEQHYRHFNHPQNRAYQQWPGKMPAQIRQQQQLAFPKQPAFPQQSAFPEHSAFPKPFYT